MSIERRRIDDTLKRTGNMIRDIERDRFSGRQSDLQLLTRVELANNSLDILLNRNLNEEQRNMFFKYKNFLNELRMLLMEGRR